MKDSCKFSLIINLIPNGLEKQMSFTINNKLVFINSFQFLTSSLGNNDFKYLSHEIHNNVLDLVKQKEFCSYEYMNDFEKFKEELQL